MITPLAAAIPAERRGIARDEDELARPQSRRSAAGRHDAEGLVIHILADGPRRAAEVRYG
ncbi:hypothetical protein [Streptomyces sp. NRRL S-1521]|uniref:hypothetical protein n=1 Tax=Streptomyces sp. NRRL S-1521 TaxID=1609100 RepID=UPI00074AE747|nr:hypothetical protein [Streptomyces sp. NRRL S-1521]KUL63992.1 hypothetical protein ADL30_00535 [Streptomyces sp. NRRL S-1521]